MPGRRRRSALDVITLVISATFVGEVTWAVFVDNKDADHVVHKVFEPPRWTSSETPTRDLAPAARTAAAYADAGRSTKTACPIGSDASPPAALRQADHTVGAQGAAVGFADASGALRSSAVSIAAAASATRAMTLVGAVHGTSAALVAKAAADAAIAAGGSPEDAAKATMAALAFSNGSVTDLAEVAGAQAIVAARESGRSPLEEDLVATRAITRLDGRAAKRLHDVRLSQGSKQNVGANETKANMSFVEFQGFKQNVGANETKANMSFVELQGSKQNVGANETKANMSFVEFQGFKQNVGANETKANMSFVEFQGSKQNVGANETKANMSFVEFQGSKQNVGANETKGQFSLVELQGLKQHVGANASEEPIDAVQTAVDAVKTAVDSIVDVAKDAARAAGSLAAETASAAGRSPATVAKAATEALQQTNSLSKLARAANVAGKLQSKAARSAVDVAFSAGRALLDVAQPHGQPPEAARSAADVTFSAGRALLDVAQPHGQPTEARAGSSFMDMGEARAGSSFMDMEQVQEVDDGERTGVATAKRVVDGDGSSATAEEGVRQLATVLKGQSPFGIAQAVVELARQSGVSLAEGPKIASDAAAKVATAAGLSPSEVAEAASDAAMAAGGSPAEAAEATMAAIRSAPVARQVKLVVNTVAQGASQIAAATGHVGQVLVNSRDKILSPNISRQEVVDVSGATRAAEFVPVGRPPEPTLGPLPLPPLAPESAVVQIAEPVAAPASLEPTSQGPWSELVQKSSPPHLSPPAMGSLARRQPPASMLAADAERSKFSMLAKLTTEPSPKADGAPAAAASASAAALPMTPASSSQDDPNAMLGPIFLLFLVISAGLNGLWFCWSSSEGIRRSPT
eukprot:TRINITY_DN4155_c0_g1_i1.p1 TRINITY_DN4155_c0_g1~~TRINITY_DN4155_c0_g1_i1.p1  ORF type:complete len:866 (-),score=197.03 TRINITY_DN4155_c0_g1_i1:292-2889(-)